MTPRGTAGVSSGAGSGTRSVVTAEQPRASSQQRNADTGTIHTTTPASRLVEHGCIGNASPSAQSMDSYLSLLLLLQQTPFRLLGLVEETASELRVIVNSFLQRLQDTTNMHSNAMLFEAGALVSRCVPLLSTSSDADATSAPAAPDSIILKPVLRLIDETGHAPFQSCSLSAVDALPAWRWVLSSTLSHRGPLIAALRLKLLQSVGEAWLQASSITASAVAPPDVGLHAAALDLYSDVIISTADISRHEEDLIRHIIGSGIGTNGSAIVQLAPRVLHCTAALAASITGTGHCAVQLRSFCSLYLRV